MGMVAAEPIPKQQSAGDCLSYRGGPRVEFVEGSVGGREAVKVSGALIGLAPTFADLRVVDGLQVAGGQECVMGNAPVCDNVVFAKKEHWVYFFRWMETYPSVQALPATSEALLATPQASKALRVLRGLQLDPPTLGALAAIAESRRTGTAIRLAGLGATAGALAVGTATGDTDTVDSSGDYFESGMDIADLLMEEEKPIVKQHPKLVPLYGVVKSLGLNGIVCVAVTR